jgi:hypothetical protein
MIAGGDDEVIPAAAVRAVVHTLRAAGVLARYYEVPGAPHALRPLYPTIAKAWNDMLAGVTQVPHDGLGEVAIVRRAPVGGDRGPERRLLHDGVAALGEPTLPVPEHAHLR